MESVCGNKLRIIKTRTLILRLNEFSEELLLADPEGEGDMYFRFCIKYATGNTANTQIDPKDKFHADIIIETRPNSMASIDKPVSIGGYGREEELLFNFHAYQYSMDGRFNITVTFYAQ